MRLLGVSYRTARSRDTIAYTLDLRFKTRKPSFKAVTETGGGVGEVSILRVAASTKTGHLWAIAEDELGFRKRQKWYEIKLKTNLKRLCLVGPHAVTLSK